MESQRTPARAPQRRVMLGAVALTVAVALSGCGSSSGSDASATTTGKTDTTVDKTVTTAAETETTTEPDRTETTTPAIDPSLSIDAAATKVIENIDTSSFCSGVVGFAGVFQALFNGFGSDAERPDATPAEKAAFDEAVQAWAAEMQKVVPPELADDFAVFAQDPTGLNAEQTPEQKKASDRVGDYAQDNCDLPDVN